MRRGENRSTQGKTGVPGEKPEYPGKNRSARGKTGVPGEKQECPGKNLSVQRREPANSTNDVESGNRTRATLMGGVCFSPLCHHCSPQLCLLKSAYALSRVIRDITGGEWGGRRVFPIPLSLSMWVPSASFIFFLHLLG